MSSLSLTHGQAFTFLSSAQTPSYRETTCFFILRLDRADAPPPAPLKPPSLGPSCPGCGRKNPASRMPRYLLSLPDWQLPKCGAEAACLQHSRSGDLDMRAASLLGLIDETVQAVGGMLGNRTSQEMGPRLLPACFSACTF